MAKLNLHKWAVVTAQVVYENSVDEDTGAFDVTVAAAVIKDAGKDLIQAHEIGKGAARCANANATVT